MIILNSLRLYDNKKGILLRGPVQERPATEWHLLLANHRHQVLVPQGLLRHGNCRGRLDRKLFRKLKSCIFLKVIASALKDHVQNDLDPDQDHLLEIDHRSRSDPDLT